HNPIKFEGSAGLTAKDGSTSAFGKKVSPAKRGPSQLGPPPSPPHACASIVATSVIASETIRRGVRGIAALYHRRRSEAGHETVVVRRNGRVRYCGSVSRRLNV